jgi:hypothetical protein
MQFNFGIGSLTLIPSGANPTPVQVGVLQDVSVDLSLSTKELRGSLQFPVDIARAAGKISGKAKSGAISGQLINSILTGSTSATGRKAGTTESSAIPTTPFTITVTNSATFSEDLGVLNLTTGLPMTRVASAPATGQYSVAAGVYTFAAADTGQTVSISYSYSIAGTGRTITYNNQLMGSGTVYAVALYNNFRSKDSGWRFPAATFPKLSMGMKNEDYTMTDLDFECFADSTGKVLEYFGSE